MAAAAPNPEDSPRSSGNSGGGSSSVCGTPSSLAADGDAEEAEDFASSSHCSELSRRQNEQRKQGLFCDVTLAFSSSGAAAGGVQTCEFAAHRSVLAAATYYFTPLLSGQFSESVSGRVDMKEWSSETGPDAETVESVIQYMYTGEIRVSTCNVHEVLELADRFLLVQLKDFCGEFLKKKLSLTNCVAVHSLAHMYTLDQLALRAADMIRRNFHKVIQDEEFYTLPFHLVRNWLSDDQITVDSEEVLFEAVLKWVQKMPEERGGYFEELFRLLRLPQIKPTYLTRVVKNERMVASNEACLRLVSEALEGYAIRFENVNLADLELWSSFVASFQPRFGQNMDVIMVVGGVSEGGDYLSECVGYFVYEDRWVNLPHIHNHLDGHAIAATDSHVYVAGSMEPGFAKTVERYNPNYNTWEQHRRPRQLQPGLQGRQRVRARAGQVAQPGVGAQDPARRQGGERGGPLRLRDGAHARRHGQRRRAEDGDHPLRHRQPPVAGRGLAAAGGQLLRLPDGRGRHQLLPHGLLLPQELRHAGRGGPPEDRRPRRRRDPGEPAARGDQHRGRRHLPL
ncbi:kelch-like protein 11 isoform X2 [Syngnathus scovelli]|uniref:kelch-like protein 11 isoform X2 n=1 Tax=Syngnathus scovelli TaxID=161590 RepID=UPI002110DEF0|nr:kelch-like protein 11 isoform X2 [Syngnathus scovelli]